MVLELAKHQVLELAVHEKDAGNLHVGHKVYVGGREIKKKKKKKMSFV